MNPYRRRERIRKLIKTLTKVRVPLYWCDTCNVPLLTRICGKCSQEGRPVLLTAPADARPVSKVELLDFQSAVKAELNGEYPYPHRKVVLFNKIPYPDAADEVVIDGYIIGHRYYDLEEKVWRFKPLYIGASEVLRRKVGYYAIVNLTKLTRNYEIHKDKILEANLPPKGEKHYVVLGTASGYEGIGVITRSGRIRVLKSWSEKNYRWNTRDPDWREVVEANEARIAILEQEAVDFVRKVSSETGLPALVSFSGGKDSLVTYHLVEKALGKVPLLFNDTGLELPETVEYVRKFAESRGAEVILASAGDIFWLGLAVLGPPARDYRWCCKTCKLVPTASTISRFFKQGVLSFVGQRRLESAARAASPRVYKNRWLPGVVVAAPILNWSALEVWLYIFREKLEVNPLYLNGFDRLGCWLCPAVELGEVEYLKRIHPELWKMWENKLRSYAEEQNLPEDWLRLALWRWLRPPGDISRLAKGVSAHALRAPRVKIYSGPDSGYIAVKKPLHQVDAYVLSSTLTPLGEVHIRDSTTLFLNKVKVTVLSKGEELEVRFNGPVDAGKLVKSVTRASLCVGCGSCELWCPRSAVRVIEGAPHTDLSLCNHCGVCNDVCPVSEYILRNLKFSTLQEEIGK